MEHAPHAVVTQLRQMLGRGELDLPLPAVGRTRDRWAALADWGSADLQLARLAEGHTDAVAILAEAGLPALPGAYGVWAARPAGTGPRLRDGRLDGELRFCSGADQLDHALVVADRAPSGPGPVAEPPCLVDVRLDQPGVHPDPSSWRATAMADTHTWTVRFTDVAVTREVGGPGWYVDRPGFAVGGGGVAAVWWGGAAGLLSRAFGHAGGRGHAAGRGHGNGVHADGRVRGVDPHADPHADPHRRAHLGELHAVLAAVRALLDAAADAVDADPAADHTTAMATVRCAVEHGCREVLDRLPRALGPAVCSGDEELAAQLAHLQLYLRQHHGERDHAELAARLLTRPPGRPA